LFSHLKRNENEINRKQSEKTFISFRIEAKRKDRKRNEAKRKNYGSKTKRKYALLISLWSEAKNSKRNETKRSEKNVVFFHVSVRNACETDLVSLRFALKRKFFFAKPAHPSSDLSANAVNVLASQPKPSMLWGMRHISTALYFYGASKKTLHKPRVTFGNILFKISYSLDYYLQLLC
jgi:hypothetical protein